MDPTKEEFVKGYRFLRIPPAYAGESFTKGYLLVYFLTKSNEEKKMYLYETSYKVPINAKFLKFAKDDISLNGLVLEIKNEKNLAEKFIEFNDIKKEVTMILKEEFELNPIKVMDKIFEFQKEAKERGWIVLC
jgi:hypothetical protein